MYLVLNFIYSYIYVVDTALNFLSYLLSVYLLFYNFLSILIQVNDFKHYNFYLTKPTS